MRGRPISGPAATGPAPKPGPKARTGELARLWAEQETWRWRLVVPAVIVGVGAIAIPQRWQTSTATGWFYGVGMLAWAYLTATWMKKWIAYWRAYHRIQGDTFWSARRLEATAWWTTHPWYGRVAALGLFVITIGAYAYGHWPNAGVANIFLIAGLAAALVASRLTAR